MKKQIWITVIIGGLIILAFLIWLLNSLRPKISADQPLINEYKNEVYSIQYPDSIKLLPGEPNYVQFSKIKLFGEPTYEDLVLQIILESETFDPANHYEIYTRGEPIQELELISFIEDVSAATADSLKINNIEQVKINDNTYYTYSFIYIGTKNDVFIYPIESSYYKFVFLNQDSKFIKKIMNSVKFNKTN